MSAVETGQMSAVETGQMSAAETGQMSAVETGQMLKSQIRGLASKQQWGLSNSWVVIATEKSACGKLPSSNRACQVPSRIGPKPKPSQVQILVDQSSSSGQKHKILFEMGRESTVWPETWSK